MTTILKGDNAAEFELSFTRENLPDVQDGFGDSAWATATFRVATDDDSWEESVPCMNLFEFTNLADWLEAVGASADGAPEISECELLEPELRFTLVQQEAETVTIRIHFHIENRPEEFQVDAPTDAPFVDVKLPRIVLIAAGGTLRDDLQRMSSTGKDDLVGDVADGILGEPDEDLNLVDSIQPDPPGAGEGEDNAGDR